MAKKKSTPVEKLKRLFEQWKPAGEFQRIAVAIGRHFFSPENDHQAFLLGQRCVWEIEKILRKRFKD